MTQTDTEYFYHDRYLYIRSGQVDINDRDKMKTYLTELGIDENIFLYSEVLPWGSSSVYGVDWVYIAKEKEIRGIHISKFKDRVYRIRKVDEHFSSVPMFMFLKFSIDYLQKNNLYYFFVKIENDLYKITKTIKYNLDKSISMYKVTSEGDILLSEIKIKKLIGNINIDDICVVDIAKTDFFIEDIYKTLHEKHANIIAFNIHKYQQTQDIINIDIFLRLSETSNDVDIAETLYYLLEQPGKYCVITEKPVNYVVDETVEYYIKLNFKYTKDYKLITNKTPDIDIFNDIWRYFLKPFEKTRDVFNI